MFPLCAVVMLLCLQLRGLCTPIHIVEMLNLEVELGESVTLPCNGSAYLEEEESVQWEAMGDDVAILQGGATIEGDQFKGRIQLPSEDQLREGDWSVVFQHTMLSDSDMYECILQGRKTISTVWLSVAVPHVERSQVVAVGDKVDLECYIHISRSQSLNDLQVWWTRNGNTIVSTQQGTAEVSNPEDVSRISLMSDTTEKFHLLMTPTIMSDNGEYHCLYKTRDSEDPRPGTPESITLTVLETTATDNVFHPAETTTSTEVETTESPADLIPVLLEDSTQPMNVTPESQSVEACEETVTSFLDKVFHPAETTTSTEVETTESPADLILVLLEDSTQPINVMTESQPMEAFEETMTSFPDEGSLETSLQWDTLPWIRIGLITGVLLVTAVALCILGALHKIQ